MNAFAVVASDLKIYRGKNLVLDIAEFRLKAGEVMALIGVNGSGKSTLVQALALLLKPDTGRIFIQGEEVTPKKELSLRRKMAVVFQEPLLLDTSVYNNVASGLLLRGCKSADIDQRVKEWLTRLGIESLAFRQARFLSGGESQRVSLARAFAVNPEVLFLDEPFSALDYPTKRTLITELSEILKATGIATVVVTHDPSEIPLIAGRVTVLHGGRIAQSGTLEEIRVKPASKTVAALVDAANYKPA
ncbi:ABC transporter ATP-binding protein [Pelotomaculum propionicicum]|uniref:Sulfate/thiosulfate import ATP-binding protein CysA n=1 Tax=Pelotomaculum propionicicum TaxID=258475 RepID=A0A4Y7RJ59_9FIRM|nr:ABC transporter ATP-binding protein [Pelotomaculum propionicicum]NLI11513.1 ABC transporter ATP-binding protein [Peptococcaceae bacterium]TEB09024.1 Sulfate/thiosulfate import ATP-binding protein CysA [Pelotomaculum propionicicum]